MSQRTTGDSRGCLENATSLSYHCRPWYHKSENLQCDTTADDLIRSKQLVAWCGLSFLFRWQPQQDPNTAVFKRKRTKQRESKYLEVTLEIQVTSSDIMWPPVQWFHCFAPRLVGTQLPVREGDPANATTDATALVKRTNRKWLQLLGNQTARTERTVRLYKLYTTLSCLIILFPDYILGNRRFWVRQFLVKTPSAPVASWHTRSPVKQPERPSHLAVVLWSTGLPRH